MSAATPDILLPDHAEAGPRDGVLKPVGAVLVMGGGIAGVQSALDLAEQGYYVYLVENSPAIGGTMAMLDKTFPTNDCSMCILSPKLVEAERHLNIELITYADVISLEGEPGRFKARIRKRARSIDPDKCVGCGACVENCLVQNQIHLPHDGDIRVVLPEQSEELQILDDILQRHNFDSANLIAMLLEINERFRYLSEPHLNYVSLRTQIPLSQIYHVATFYSAFSLTPRGKHEIKVCMGTTCHLMGAPRILEEICGILNVEPGQTTRDGLFTVETVNCLGQCAFAPAIAIDHHHFSMERGRCREVIDQFVQSHAQVPA